MDTSPNIPVPKKSCFIQLMFAINSDKEAVDIKEKINAIVADIKEKRLTFQINET